MRPSFTSTLCSFTQAEVTLRRVVPARATPTRSASSKLLSERALISVTRATEDEDPLDEPPADALDLGLMGPPSCLGEDPNQTDRSMLVKEVGCQPRARRVAS